MFKAQEQPLPVISEDGFAFIADSSLMEDLPVTGPEISLASSFRRCRNVT